MKARVSNRRATENRARGRIQDVTASRAIPWQIRLMLWVRAGGRCEFDGCNKYLLEHELTFTAGNYGEAAHIVAFKPDGPRGRSRTRPAKINDVTNLMLLS